MAECSKARQLLRCLDGMQLFEYIQDSSKIALRFDQERHSTAMGKGKQQARYPWLSASSTLQADRQDMGCHLQGPLRGQPSQTTQTAPGLAGETLSDKAGGRQDPIPSHPIPVSQITNRWHSQYIRSGGEVNRERLNYCRRCAAVQKPQCGWRDFPMNHPLYPNPQLQFTGRRWIHTCGRRRWRASCAFITLSTTWRHRMSE